MRGAPARAIQELAGHANRSTTQCYMYLTPAATRAAIALLEVRYGNGVATAQGAAIRSEYLRMVMLSMP